MADSYRRALDAKDLELTVISESLLAEAISHARTSPRRRIILPFHKRPEDPLHRMLNAVQVDSYVRPHRHLDPPKSEAFIVLRGALVFFTFEDDGRLRDSIRLAAGSERFGVDLAPGIYHSFAALEPDTVIYEVKNGPYEAANDKSFAPFAPEEGTPEAADYVRSLLAAHARRGEP
jgi:cupin fold WbuC family metalloprotein